MRQLGNLNESVKNQNDKLKQLIKGKYGKIVISLRYNKAYIKKFQEFKKLIINIVEKQQKKQIKDQFWE